MALCREDSAPFWFLQRQFYSGFGCSFGFGRGAGCFSAGVPAGSDAQPVVELALERAAVQAGSVVPDGVRVPDELPALALALAEQAEPDVCWKAAWGGLALALLLVALVVAPDVADWAL